jgi:hypothetical protein
MGMSRNSVIAILAALLLASCTPTITYTPIPPYDGPIAPPQVAYRIDNHRYFEIVPKENLACARARLFYVDTDRGIRTNVTSWDRINYGRLVIDAAADQYLISPIIGMEPDCQTGDYASTMCDPRLRYSVDGGRTWKVTIPKNADVHGDVYLVGDAVYYSGQRARIPDLAAGEGAWAGFSLDGPNKLPPVVKPSIDSEPHCDNSKTIRIKE